MSKKIRNIEDGYTHIPKPLTFFSFIELQAQKKTTTGRLGTAKTYRDALRSFSLFRQAEDIIISDLNRETMEAYEAWLKGRGLKRNSSSCYLRTLRTLYRKAVEQGLTEDRNIFRRVFTGFAKTAKRAISLEAIQSIRKLSLPVGSPLAFARDIFMISIYLQGISFVDLAYLRKSDIKNGQLQYNRRKTGQTITVGWEPSMQDIVDTYASLTQDTPYLLPIISKADGTERHQFEKMEHNTNVHLKKIGQMVGLNMPLTTYVARHTWASTMNRMGVDLSVISRGLGHESLKTTQVYLAAIDTKDVIRANQKMIRKILG